MLNKKVTLDIPNVGKLFLVIASETHDQKALNKTANKLTQDNTLHTLQELAAEILNQEKTNDETGLKNKLEQIIEQINSKPCVQAGSHVACGLLTQQKNKKVNFFSISVGDMQFQLTTNNATTKTSKPELKDGAYRTLTGPALKESFIKQLNEIAVKDILLKLSASTKISCMVGGELVDVYSQPLVQDEKITVDSTQKIELTQDQKEIANKPEVQRSFSQPEAESKLFTIDDDDKNQITNSTTQSNGANLLLDDHDVVNSTQSIIIASAVLLLGLAATALGAVAATTTAVAISAMGPSILIFTGALAVLFSAAYLLASACCSAPKEQQELLDQDDEQAVDLLDDEEDKDPLSTSVENSLNKQQENAENQPLVNNGDGNSSSAKNPDVDEPLPLSQSLKLNPSDEKQNQQSPAGSTAKQSILVGPNLFNSGNQKDKTTDEVLVRPNLSTEVFSVG